VELQHQWIKHFHTLVQFKGRQQVDECVKKLGRSIVDSEKLISHII